MGQAAAPLAVINTAQGIISERQERRDQRSERRAIQEKMARDYTRKTNLIRAAQARQRAKFGAGGMAGDGMTEMAVKNRIGDEIADQFTERNLANQARIDQINRGLANNRTNLVRRALTLGGHAANINNAITSDREHRLRQQKLNAMR